jgi:hypothetical protein
VRKNHFGAADLRGLFFWTDPVCLIIWLAYYNQTNQTDQMNKTGWRSFSASSLGGPRPSVEEAHGKTSGCHTRGKHRSDDPTGREAYSPRFTLPKFPSQIRHMGFRPEPFIL